METPASEHLATLQAKQFLADHETNSKNGASVAEGAAPDVDARPSPSAPPVHSAHEGRTSLLRALGKRVATLAIALLAIVVALVTWQHYVTAPWTRDGSVRVQVANVAPQVSGQINELRVVDNQFVHKGDVLYTIDPFDFEVAQRTGVATAQQRAADLQVKQVASERRQHLTDLATTPEEQQTFAGKPRSTAPNNNSLRRRSISREPRLSAPSMAMLPTC